MNQKLNTLSAVAEIVMNNLLHFFYIYENSLINAVKEDNEYTWQVTNQLRKDFIKTLKDAQDASNQ
jgi:hypothetical protein